MDGIAEDGSKMSKSKQKYPLPQEVIEMGADAFGRTSSILQLCVQSHFSGKQYVGHIRTTCSTIDRRSRCMPTLTVDPSLDWM